MHERIGKAEELELVEWGEVDGDKRGEGLAEA